MNELKTLKEIIGYYSSDSDEFEANKYFANKIKEEAIKWFKELIEIGNNHITSSDFRNEVNIGGLKLNIWAENHEHYGATSFIEHFFNLTDEDLK